MIWIRDLFFKSPAITGLIAFLLFLGLGVFLSLKEFQIVQLEEENRLIQTAEQVEDRVQDVLNTANSAVNILAYLVETDKVDDNFEEIGRSIIDNIPIIDQIQFLDSGVIIANYPMAGNEVVIGYDILSDPLRNQEALYAIQSKRLFFAGPFTLRQGGEAIVARLPIFEEEKFVGFAAALINWEKFKDQIFGNFQKENSEFIIDLIKVNPSDNTEYSLLKSDFSIANGPEERIFIKNGNWVIKVQLKKSQAMDSILLLFIVRVLTSILVAFLLFKFAQQPYTLQKKIIETTKELQLSNQRFRLATKANSQIIWDWDLITNKTVRSENFEKLLGYKQDNYSSHSDFWKSLIHPDDLEKVEKNLKKTLTGSKKKWSQEFRVRKHNGEIISILDRGLIIRDKSGKATRLIGSTQDISERKKVEDEIANQKQRISNVIEGTNAGTWEWNVQTGETIFNETWAEIIGYKLEELQPVSIKTWERFAHPEDFLESGRLLNLHFTGESDRYEAECRMRHKDGHWVWVLDRGKVLSWTSDGKPLMMFGTHVDITQKKRREEEIKTANQKLQAANDELKSFASVASHDMKEPLRMISSFLELLEMRYRSVLDEKGIQYIKFAVDGAKRLSRLTGDMMEYATIGFDSKDLKKLDLNAIVQEVLSIKQSELEQKKVKLEVHKLPSVLGIETPIKTVFINLISNAIKYQEKGNIPSIKISSESLKDQVKITVEDNGIGIEKDYFNQIFKLFGRLNSKREYSGTGLGLSVCKKIIQQHGGEIWVESTPGKGSKFHFTLRKYEATSKDFID